MALDEEAMFETTVSRSMQPQNGSFSELKLEKAGETHRERAVRCNCTCYDSLYRCCQIYRQVRRKL